MSGMKTKLLLKVASGDKSITVLDDIVKLNKKAVAYAKNPALSVIGDAAERDDAVFFNNTANSVGSIAASPRRTAAQEFRDALLTKPSYIDVLKNRAGDAWSWTKGKWNQLSPETQKSIGDIGLGAAGAMTGDALIRLLGGKKNRALRLLAMLGGAGLGIAGNRYLQNPAFKSKVNTGFNSLINKFKG